MKESATTAKHARLSPLEFRKRLLIMESELNRVQLINEVKGIKDEIHHLTRRVQEMGSSVTSAAKVAVTVAGIAGLFSGARKPEEPKKKSSLIAKAINGVRMGASLWGMVRSHLK